MELEPENATLETLAAVTLHNFLRIKNPCDYIPHNSVDNGNPEGTVRQEDWRQTKETMQRLLVC